MDYLPYKINNTLLYYSNSSPDGVNWVVFLIFYGIYYLYSLKNALVFVAVGIFRAKIESFSEITSTYMIVAI